jgi:hypothetical protein
MDLSSLDPTLIPLVAAGAGALTGALAGGIVAFIIAPSRAEREERGKQRVSGRREVAAGITAFQYALLQARERRLNMEKGVEVQNYLESAAVALAQVVQESTTHLPRWKRWRLRRSVRKIVGPQAWRLAELRPDGMHSSAFDAATAKVNREVRPTPGQVLIPAARVSPLDPRGNRLLHRIGKLHRRASRR